MRLDKWGALALLLAGCGDNHESSQLDLDDVSVTTPEDTDRIVEVRYTAIDKSKAVLAVTTPPMHGTLSGNGPRWTYTPAPNYFGPDSFIVEATENNKSAMATVTIDVTPVNDVPVANADSFPAGFDTPLTIAQSTLLMNDTDIEGTALTVASVTAMTHGTVALSGSDVVFTPEAGFTGAASFTYKVSDGDAESTGTVSVTIGDDMAPIAVDDTAATNEDVTLVLDDTTVLANDTDAENHTLAVTAVANATHGTVSHAGTQITFVPDANYHGPATFEYTVGDGFKSDTGLVAVTVGPVNDLPVAIADAATTTEDTALVAATSVFLTNDTDLDGDTLSITAVQPTANTHGMVALAGTTITYTPDANFNGAAAFTYTVSDGNGGTATGTVDVTVTPVQDAPVAIADALTTLEDTVATTTTLAANDTDADNDTLTVTAVAPTANTHGSVALAAGTVTYTPAANYNGPADFTYTISDGNGNTAIGTVSVTVTPVDDAPAAVDDTATVAEASTNTVIDVLANDTDLDAGAKTVASVSTPAHGTASVGGGGANVTYTPAANYCNQGPNVPPDSFTYTLNGGSTAMVFVTVTCQCGLGKPTTFVVGGL